MASTRSAARAPAVQVLPAERRCPARLVAQASVAHPFPARAGPVDRLAQVGLVDRLALVGPVDQAAHVLAVPVV
jgi:hypothetical protein